MGLILFLIVAGGRVQHREHARDGGVGPDARRSASCKRDGHDPEGDPADLRAPGRWIGVIGTTVGAALGVGGLAGRSTGSRSSRSRPTSTSWSTCRSRCNPFDIVLIIVGASIAGRHSRPRSTRPCRRPRLEPVEAIRHE